MLQRSSGIIIKDVKHHLLRQARVADSYGPKAHMKAIATEMSATAVITQTEAGPPEVVIARVERDPPDFETTKTDGTL